MMKMTMKYNGKTIRSAGQLEREVKHSIEKEIQASLRRAAGPGVRLKKTRDGYLAEGSADQIERMKKRLR